MDATARVRHSPHSPHLLPCAPPPRTLTRLVSAAAYDSFLMYSRVTEIDSIHLLDEKDLNSPYKPIENK